MEYKILKDYSAEGLSEEVNKHIADGWQLYGSPCLAVVEPRSTLFAQAVTKAEGERRMGTLGLGSAKAQE